MRKALSALKVRDLCFSLNKMQTQSPSKVYREIFSNRRHQSFSHFLSLSDLGLSPGTVVSALYRSETLLALPEQLILRRMLSAAPSPRFSAPLLFSLKNNGHIVAKTQVTLYASLSLITQIVSFSTIKPEL